MTSSSLPPDGPANGPSNSAPWPATPPPGVPPQAPRSGAPWPTTGTAPAPRESRGVSFFVAIFLGILLVASAGLNVLLLLVSVGSLAGAGLGGADLGDAPFDEAHVAGERAARKKVLQVPIRGAIAEAGSALLGGAGGTVTQVKRALRQAAADGVHGLLLTIDSPGGGVTDSDEIYELIRAFRRAHPDKPVAALFEDMAASGGYYIGVAAERIFARRTTITGSIGVIMSSWNFGEAAKRFGVDQTVIRSARTPMKDILSPMRPMRDDERAMLTAIVDELFDQFVSVVDEGREQLDRTQVLALATGAIYTASQALASGLIDAIGDHTSVAAWFEQKLGQPVAIVEHRRRAGFGDLLFGAKAPPPSFEQSLAGLLHASTGPRFLYFWEGGR